MLGNEYLHEAKARIRDAESTVASWLHLQRGMASRYSSGSPWFLVKDQWGDCYCLCCGKHGEAHTLPGKHRKYSSTDGDAIVAVRWQWQLGKNRGLFTEEAKQMSGITV